MAKRKNTLWIQPIDRFMDKVATHGDCWEWQARLNNNGYGVFSVRGAKVYAHRWAYEYFTGEIPDGLSLDHLCRNRPCVNPAHLEPVSQAENMRRMSAAQTHCANGHEFTQENTYLRPDTGRRQCRTCAHDRYVKRSTDLTTGCPGVEGAVSSPFPGLVA